MDKLLTVENIDKNGLYGFTSYRHEPVYKNSRDFFGLDPIEPYFIRKHKADQISKPVMGDYFGHHFGTIPSPFPKPDGRDYTTYDGILIPKIEYPGSVADFDAYVSPASHHEIARVAFGTEPDKGWRDKVARFALNYAVDKLSGNRILITDFRAPVEGRGELENQALLKIFKPSYYFFRQNGVNIFEACKSQN